MASSQIQNQAQKLLQNNAFTAFILVAIVLNGLLVGWQTADSCPSYVRYIQLFLLVVFFAEIILRWLGRESTSAYLSDAWNYFDIFILLAGVLPEVVDILMPQPDGETSQSSILATLRLLRIVQLARSVRAIEELRTLVLVLVKSLRSLFYMGFLFFLVLYIYAILGVSLFKNRDYKNSEHLQQTSNHPDPWGSIGEGSFTLFRVLTGDDWSQLRYDYLDNEQTRKDDGAKSRPVVSNTTVTVFYLSWIVIAFYLLMNLLAAIFANFQMVLKNNQQQEAR